MSHLSGKTAGGLNGKVVLKSTTVKDDKSADVLTGAEGLDWFWGVSGELKDRVTGERLN